MQNRCGSAWRRTILTVLCYVFQEMSPSHCQTDGDVGTRATEHHVLGFFFHLQAAHIARSSSATSVRCVVKSTHAPTQSAIMLSASSHSENFAVCPVTSGRLSHLLISTVGSVNLLLQTLTLFKITLSRTPLAMWALKRTAASQGKGSSASRRRLTEMAKTDGGSHSAGPPFLRVFRALIKASPIVKGLPDVAGEVAKTFWAEWVLEAMEQAAAVRHCRCRTYSKQEGKQELANGTWAFDHHRRELEGVGGVRKVGPPVRATVNAPGAFPRLLI